MLHHPGVVFGQQCNIQRLAAAGDVIEADLVAEGGLASARRALDDIQASLEKAAPQDGVEAANAARHPIEPGNAAIGHQRFASTQRGKVTLNTEPPPCASSTVIVPSMASTS